MMVGSLKEKTAKGLFWGGISNGIQQIFALCFGLFLARILTPGDYGIVGMLAIFTGFANSIQEGGFIAALTNKKNVTHKDYNAVFWFNIISGILLYIILFFSAPLIASFFNEPKLLWVARIVFLSILFASLSTAQGAFLFRNLMVKERAKIDIYSLVISNTAALIMALNGMAYWGIAIQSVLYLGLGAFFRWYYSPWRPSFPFSLKPLKEMFPFSIKLLLTGLLNQITLNIFSVLLGKYYSVNQVGYYSQGNKWVNMGGGLINSTLTGIAQPVFSKVITDTQRQVQVLRKIIRFAAFLSFPIMFGLALIAKEFILITVTDKWLNSVPIIQLLCIWGAFAPICELYKNIIISHGRSDIYLYSNIIFGVFQLLLLIFMLPYGILWMVGVYVCAYFIWLLSWHLLVSHLIHLSFRDILKDISPYFFVTFIVLTISYVITYNIDSLFLKIILKILMSAVLYVLILWYSNSIILKESIMFLRQLKR
ncbi:lipopolysaccharide biosynthesis protein [Parabacteroides goldsteinii]|uniref:lipopolysaccharide biosynthesis protein n=1 Tax=Parabacteroides goldsteinii TaxID=328812 RepID=UPI0032B237FA